MKQIQRITPFLWFDDRAEAAVDFYVSVFPHSRILHATRYGEAGKEIHGRQPGSVMTIDFELDGQPFTALNGGPMFKFSEAVSFVVPCASQKDVDHYWGKLSEGGDTSAQQCGWLKDRYGLSWQIVPAKMLEMLEDPDPVKSQRVMKSMLQMKKLDLPTLERAYAG